MGELVVFAKSKEAIREDRREIFAEFDRAWAKMMADHEAAVAGLHKQIDKMVGSFEARKRKVDLASATIQNAALLKLRDAINDVNQGLENLSRLEKRSERFFGGAR